MNMETIGKVLLKHSKVKVISGISLFLSHRIKMILIKKKRAPRGGGG